MPLYLFFGGRVRLLKYIDYRKGILILTSLLEDLDTVDVLTCHCCRASMHSSARGLVWLGSSWPDAWLTDCGVLTLACFLA